MYSLDCTLPVGGNGQTSLRGHSHSVRHHGSVASETGQQKEHAGIHTRHSG